LKAPRIDWLSFLSPVFSQSWSSPFFFAKRLILAPVGRLLLR
jgi:hypothetical protein